MEKKSTVSFIISLFAFFWISSSVWHLSELALRPMPLEKSSSLILILSLSTLSVLARRIRISPVFSLSLVVLLVFFSAIMLFSFDFSSSAYVMVFCGIYLYLFAFLSFPLDLASLIIVILFYVLIARFMRLEYSFEFVKAFKDSLDTIIFSVVTILAAFLLKLYDMKKTALLKDNKLLKTSVKQLTEASASFLEYANSVEEKTSLEERKRITRDLHDLIGQTSTNIIAMMTAIMRKPLDTEEEQMKMYQWILDISQHCLNQSREVLRDIRNLPENKLKGFSRFNALLETFRISTGMIITVEWTNLPSTLPGRLEEVIYSVLQESLTNSFRHGQASEIKIIFQRVNGYIHCTITDNGSAQDLKFQGGDKSLGIGQTGLEERINSIGGEISFHSGKLGYKVKTIIPETKEEDERLIDSYTHC